jgi:serine/threonine-protein kinase
MATPDAPRSQARQPIVEDPTELAGKYKLIAELGRGGMATVYLAVQRQAASVKKLVVVKQLRSDMGNDTDLVEMFLEEARLAARLSHPNVVNTFEVAEAGGQYFLAMEYLDGPSLQAVLTKIGFSGKFSFAHYLRVIIDVLAGLQHAHELTDFDGSKLNLVHRDVTPHNVMLTYDGRIKLVDFGIAKAANSAVETRTGVIKGKVTYMAPEQAFGDPIDRRTDLYAIGVMLWEAAAGTRRWKGVPNTQILQKLAERGEIPPTGAATRGLPARIDAICAKAMSYEIEGRYETAAAFRDELVDLMRDLPDQPSSEDVGRVLAEIFAGDRLRRKEVIDAQLSALDAADRGDEEFTLVVEHEAEAPQSMHKPKSRREPEGPASGPRSRRDGRIREAAPAVLDPTLAAPPASDPRRALVPLLGVVAAVALGCAVYFAIRGPKPEASTTPTTAETAKSAAIPAVTASAVAPPVAKVKLTVQTTPEGAEVTLDGVKIGTSPVTYEAAKADGDHILAMTAKGYLPLERKIPLAADAFLSLNLEKDPKAKKK